LPLPKRQDEPSTSRAPRAAAAASEPRGAKGLPYHGAHGYKPLGGKESA